MLFFLVAKLLHTANKKEAKHSMQKNHLKYHAIWRHEEIFGPLCWLHTIRQIFHAEFLHITLWVVIVAYKEDRDKDMTQTRGRLPLLSFAIERVMFQV